MIQSDLFLSQLEVTNTLWKVYVFTIQQGRQRIARFSIASKHLVFFFTTFVSSCSLTCIPKPSRWLGRMIQTVRPKNSTFLLETCPVKDNALKITISNYTSNIPIPNFTLHIYSVAETSAYGCLMLGWGMCYTFRCQAFTPQGSSSKHQRHSKPINGWKNHASPKKRFECSWNLAKKKNCYEWTLLCFIIVPYKTILGVVSLSFTLMQTLTFAKKKSAISSYPNETWGKPWMSEVLWPALQGSS